MSSRSVSAATCSAGPPTTEQLEQILPAATLQLTPAEVERLSAAL
jgi:hypothetical protein